MSDDCERLFSSAKMLLSDRRSRLKMDIIEGGECLRQWLGVIDQDDADVRVLEEKARILQETALCESRDAGVCDEAIAMTSVLSRSWTIVNEEWNACGRFFLL
ncbi:hypothetical protein E4U23_004832 [Claviceps purpurea]|nr:hypothetical protein E4U23_004832 [Claviceps purpurea]